MDNKFEVTEEIFEYFKDKNVTSNLIKKCIPNYMDYASSETVLCDDIYRSDISNELNTLLNDERKIFKPQDLCAKIKWYLHIVSAVESNLLSLVQKNYVYFV